MKRYEAYKHSGVDWIGDIPEGWEVRRIKTLFKEINERSFDGSEDLLSVSQYTGVTKKSDKVEEGDLLTNASTLEGYKIVRNGDLVSNIMLAWNGSLGFSQHDGITSPAYSIYRLKSKGEKQFFHYLFRTEKYKAEFKRQSSGVIESRLRLYSDDFLSIYSILPPLSEQTTIAQFLDNKTAKIDQLIGIRQKEIELLKERRQILIQKAVTKGLDDTVKLKDSGVDWIGEIPEHWEVTPGRTIFKERKESNKGLKNSIVLSLSYGKIIIKPEEKMYGLVPESFETYQLVYEGDIIVRGTDLQNDKTSLRTGLSHYNGIITSAYLNLIVKNSSAPSFIQLFLYVMDISKEIYKYGSGLRQNLSFNDFKLMPILDVPLDEQIQIVSYLEEIEEKIAKAILLKQQEIEKLKEYKTVLIDQVVTGKVRVNKIN